MASDGGLINKHLRNILEAVIAAISISAIIASAKSYNDVEVLKSENENTKVILIDIKTDVREIRNHLMR